MALKEYEYMGGTYQFDDSDVPDGAVPVEQKARQPKNKARQPQNKAVEPDTK